MKNKKEHVEALRTWLLVFGVWILLLVGVFRKCEAQTPEQVRRECVKQEILFPDIVTAQSILETGWYQCEDCSMRFNNIFGFRLQSIATADNKLGYLKFDTWQDAVLYYKQWQDKHYKTGSYFDFLVERHYAHNMTAYLEKLNWILNNI